MLRFHTEAMNAPKKDSRPVRKTKVRRGSPPSAASRGRRERILLVDDHPMLRAGIAELINRQADMEVCGEASTAAEGLGEIQKCKPAMVVADISMPGRSGIEFIRDARAIAPSLSILILSMHDEMIFAERVLEAGAMGYIMKESSPSDILAAIRTVLAGGIYASKRVSALALEAFGGAIRHPVNSPMKKLTPREFEVFRLLGEGVSTKDIGTRLNLSAKTVGSHRINIKEKLGVSTAAELISMAAHLHSV